MLINLITNMLFMLNITGLIIIHINLNDRINKQVIRDVSCYLIIKLIMFEFVNFDKIIISVMFGLMNIMQYLYIDTI